MKELSNTITQSRELQQRCESARMQMQATRIDSHRLMCAGRVYKIGKAICIQQY